MPANKTNIHAEPGKQEISITREFDAPRELVFKACTDPRLIPQMKLEELPGGRTRLTIQAVFQSVADRDGMLQSGMEAGLNDTYDRLEELLKQGLA
jgi:uncharacterized protein YndB with AHSA1/START domain